MNWAEVVHAAAEHLREEAHGEEVLIEDQGEGLAVVTVAARTWGLSRAVLPMSPPSSNSFEVVEARPVGAVGAVVQPRGLAVFCDGELVDLSQRDGPARFWQRARAESDPVLLAEVVMSYTARPSNVAPVQNLIVTRDDIRPHLSDQDLGDVPGFVELAAREEGQTLQVEFCSYSVGQSESDRTWCVVVYRWRVEALADGPVHWWVRPISGELRSRFYSPKA